MQHSIQDLLEYILKNISTKPESITVTSREESGTTILEISSDPEITGQIIGKQGKIIKSIRTILNLCFPSSRYIIDIKD